ncbi:MAG: hypothetical protein ACRYG5_06650 [Janthinobacterium lividum]
MKRLALALAALLSGCASYSVEPFYDVGAKAVLCCRARATNSKNINTVNFFAMEKSGTFVVRFAETGVNASAPIAAAAIAASDVTGAITSTATTAAKLIP